MLMLVSILDSIWKGVQFGLRKWKNWSWEALILGDIKSLQREGEGQIGVSLCKLLGLEVYIKEGGGGKKSQ